MQAAPAYDDVVSEVKAFLEERLAFAVGAGIREELVCLDPGIGFGKTVEHNFELVRRLDELVALGRPVLVGFSRKSSLGRIMGDPEATTGTAAASVGAAVAAFERGATILRAHDVREHVEALAARAQAVGGMKVELRGLELHGYHGVLEEERRDGPAFLYDVELEVGERGASDRIEDAVDYREVAAAVREVNDAPVPAARGARGRASRTRSSSASRSSASGCGCASPRCARPGLEVEYTRHVERVDAGAGDAAPTSGSARTSATARRRSAARPS